MIAFINNGQHFKYSRQWASSLHMYEGASSVVEITHKTKQTVLHRSLSTMPCDINTDPFMSEMQANKMPVSIVSYDKDNYLMRCVQGKTKGELTLLDNTTVVIDCESESHSKYIRTLINRGYSNYKILNTLCERLSLDFGTFKGFDIEDYLPPYKLINRLPAYKIKGYVKKKIKYTPNGKLL